MAGSVSPNWTLAVCSSLASGQRCWLLSACVEVVPLRVQQVSGCSIVSWEKPACLLFRKPNATPSGPYIYRISLHAFLLGRCAYRTYMHAGTGLAVVGGNCGTLRQLMPIKWFDMQDMELEFLHIIPLNSLTDLFPFPLKCSGLFFCCCIHSHPPIRFECFGRW